MTPFPPALAFFSISPVYPLSSGETILSFLEPHPPNKKSYLIVKLIKCDSTHHSWYWCKWFGPWPVLHVRNNSFIHSKSSSSERSAESWEMHVYERESYRSRKMGKKNSNIVFYCLELWLQLYCCTMHEVEGNGRNLISFCFSRFGYVDCNSEIGIHMWWSLILCNLNLSVIEITNPK